MQSTFRLLDGYTPTFHSWNGSVFESDLIRAALDAHGRHMSKLQVNVQGSAKENLRNRLKIQPNAYQTWSQFLYRTAVILYANVESKTYTLTISGKSCGSFWRCVALAEM